MSANISYIFNVDMLLTFGFIFFIYDYLDNPSEERSLELIGRVDARLDEVNDEDDSDGDDSDDDLANAPLQYVQLEPSPNREILGEEVMFGA